MNPKPPFYPPRLTEPADLDDIIARPPGWTFRWGLTALLIFFGLLLTVSWFIRYPDIIEARAVLTTENPPIRLVAGASARVNMLPVKNGEQVKAGDLLAVLENPASLEDVQQLEKTLTALSSPLLRGGELSEITKLSFHDILHLGSLQESYARFTQSFKDLQYYLQRDVNYQKIANLSQQIAETQRLNQSLTNQEKIMAEEVALARRNVERDSLLLANRSSYQAEYDETKSLWLRSRRELESLRSGVTQNNLRIRQMEAQILDLQQLQSDNLNSRLLTFRSDLERLRAEIEAWKQTWLLTAPIAGAVALTTAWSENQFVKEGEEVLTIVPQERAGRLVAKAFLSGEGAGKVQEGMTVHIRLDGYPHQEFGTLNGKVERIAAVPNEAGYELDITLNDSLTTSLGKAIPFRQEMQGTARIVTEKRSLLKRIFEKLSVIGD